MLAAGLTDVGLSRKQNQDAIFVSAEPIGPLPNLFIVADGMGGHKAGDVASRRAIEVICDCVQSFRMPELVQPENYLDLLIYGTQQANDAIYHEGLMSPDKRGMGTTLTLCVVNSKRIFFVHIGDSRGYRFADGRLEQITTDHTYVEELLKSKKITKEEALAHPQRHMVTKVLGMQGPCEADGLIVKKDGTKTVLLCSDGLSNMIDFDTLQIAAGGLAAPAMRAKSLVGEANKKGGHDNISVIIIDLKR